MPSRTWSAFLILLSACATMDPSPEEWEDPKPRLANLQRAALYPWTDDGHCVVREASNEWPILAERCFHALDRDRVRFRDVTGRCAVASAPAQTRPAKEPLANRTPKPEGSRSEDIFPPLPTDSNPRRPECEPIPVRHAGEDFPHNECADKFPPNRYPGMDVLVAGVRFNALQVGVRVLWEIKTHQFDTYNAFIRDQELAKELEQIRKERVAAEACGYGFVVGVSTQAHKDALLAELPTLDVVVTGCTR